MSLMTSMVLIMVPLPMGTFLRKVLRRKGLGLDFGMFAGHTLSGHKLFCGLNAKARLGPGSIFTL
jgi:hypothetical protein